MIWLESMGHSHPTIRIHQFRLWNWSDRTKIVTQAAAKLLPTPCFPAFWHEMIRLPAKLSNRRIWDVTGKCHKIWKRNGISPRLNGKGDQKHANEKGSVVLPHLKHRYRWSAAFDEFLGIVMLHKLLMIENESTPQERIITSLSPNCSIPQRQCCPTNVHTQALW